MPTSIGSRQHRRPATLLWPIVALASALALSMGVAPAQADPPGWPPGAWADCSAPSDQYCLQEARVTPVGGVATPAVSLGLSTYLTTLPSGGGPASVNWAINGWDDPAVPADVRDGDISFVFRVGQFVPRYTMAIAKDMRITTVTDGGGDTTVTITGHAVQMNWTTGPLFAACVATLDCGDGDTQADTNGTRLNFSGNTQDMSTWAPSERAAMGGMYIATNAQARPVALLIGTYPDLYWYMGALGNPHLTQSGEPARGSFNAWMPPGFFTTAGTTPSAAAAVGFDVSVGAAGGGPGGPGTGVPAIVTEQDGGVALDVPDMPFSVHAVTVSNEPPSVSPGTTAPGAPRTVTVARGASSLSPAWTAPASNGGSAVTGYLARAFTAASGGTVAGSCTTTGLTCEITGLSPGTTYHVAVTAINAMGEGTPAARVAAAPAAPPGAPTALTVAPGAGRLTPTWSAPGTNGGSAVIGYTASAYPAAIGGSAVSSCTSAGTSCTITGLTNGTTYFVSAKAANVAGDGTATARVQGIPAADDVPPVITTPSVPASVTAEAKPGRLLVSWKAPATTGGSAVTGYTARAHTGTAAGPVAGTCTGTGGATGCTIDDLPAGTDFVVEVSAANAAGSGPAARSGTVSTPDLPDAPTGLKVSAPASGRLALTWAAPDADGGDPVTGYEVLAFTAARGGEPVATCRAAPTERRCALTGLKNGTRYYLSVVAKNEVGAGPAALPRLRAVPAGPPRAPRSVTARWSGRGLLIGWDAPGSDNGAAVTGYEASVFGAATGGRLLTRCTADANDDECLTPALDRRPTVWVLVTATNRVGESPGTRYRIKTKIS